MRLSTSSHRNRAVFLRTTRRRPATMASASASSAFTSSASEEFPRSSSRSRRSVHDSDDFEEEIITNAAASANFSDGRPVLNAAVMVPDLFNRPPLVRDALRTDTSELQDETVQLCLSLMADAGVEAGGYVHSNAGDNRRAGGNSRSQIPLQYNSSGVPHLDRARHVAFLKKNLEPLPGAFVGYDASRPWLLFWCLNGLALLGEDVAPYRTRLCDTARSMQNASGGFGGGHGQASHLATTYAVVMALAVVGGVSGIGNGNGYESYDCYDLIDRRTLWKWLCRLKQPDGGFQISVGGEEDVRAAYCATVIISLLDLPLALTRESPAWISETTGNTLYSGLASYVQRCQTYEGGISAQPGSEAHGGYAFCALGCLSILDSPDRSILRYINVPRLVSWLSSRQYAPEGGFSGRTNKLVDGCYSHWVGDCWPLVEACLGRSKVVTDQPLPLPAQSLFSREGLIRYILCCCQDQTKRGGLRDKPEKMSDPYHTCYVLSGLSSAQHKWDLTATSASWSVSPFEDGAPQVFDEADRVSTVHPVYTIAADRVEKIQAYFQAKGGL